MYRNNLILFVFALIFLPAIILLPAQASGEGKVTLMVYITGSDLESNYGSASADIQEMLDAGVDVDTTVLLMTGGTSQWCLGFDPGKTTISEIGPRGMRVVRSFEAMNMGDPDTLSLFLDTGVEYAPADRYALILWDHGGGPLNGLCYDELYSNNCLTLSELRDALSRSPFGSDQRLAWIGLDACLMASVETASVLAPFSDYLIASEETEPSGGWNYSFLNGLSSDADGAATGKRIIDSYISAYSGDKTYRLTLSCIRLSEIEAVEQAVNHLFSILRHTLSPDTFSVYSNHRRDTVSFGRSIAGLDYDLADLGHLAGRFESEAPEAAIRLENAVSNAVVYHLETIPDASGLTVYSPYSNNGLFVQAAQAGYAALDFADEYYVYLCDYAALWLGDKLTDFDGIAAAAAPPSDNLQTLTLSLTPEQVAGFASAELFIVSETFVGSTYVPVFSTQDVELLPDGTLSAEYRYQALYFVDENGEPLSDALQYERIDDTYFIRGYFSGENDHGLNAAWLMFRKVGNDLNYAGCIMLEEGQTFQEVLSNVNVPAPRQDTRIDTDRWSALEIWSLPLVPSYDVNGSLLPVNDWRYNFDETPGMYAEVSTIDLHSPWSLVFIDQQFTGRNLYAQYVVTDTQGYRTASPLLPIRNNNIRLSSDVRVILMENPDVSVTLTGADFVMSRKDEGLYLRLDIENKTEGLIYLNAERFSVNNTALNNKSGTLIINPGKTQSAAFFIATDEIPPLQENRLETISMSLILENADFNVLAEQDVEFPLEMDLSETGIAEEKTGAALAECTAGNILWQLMDLSINSSGEADALLYAFNNSGEDYEFTLSMGHAAINRALICRCFEYRNTLIPAGRGIYIPLRFSLVSSPSGADDASGLEKMRSDLYWGISQLNRLDIMLRDETRLSFDLGTSVPLYGKPASSGPQLLEAGPLQASLHCLQWDGEELWIDIDLENTSGRPMRLALDRAVLDDSDAQQPRLCTETDSEFSGSYFSALPADCLQRARLKLNADHLPGQITLEFCYAETDESAEECYTTAAMLYLPEAAESGMIPGENVTVLPASAAAGEPVDLMTFFSADITVPEHYEQYAVSLYGQLSPDQAENAASVEALLVLPSSEQLMLYATIPCELSADGRFTAEYNGLLLGPEGYDDVLSQTVDENVFSAGRLWLSGTHSSQPSQFVLFSAFRAILDENEARLTKVESETPVRDGEHFNTLNCVHLVYPLPAGEPLWPHYSEWERLALSGVNVNVRLEMPRFRLVPAEQFGLYVIFCVINHDGTGYSLPEMIPYHTF